MNEYKKLNNFRLEITLTSQKESWDEKRYKNMCDFYTVAHLLTFLTTNTCIKYYLKLSKMSEIKRELSGKMPDYICSSTRKL